MKSFIGLIPTGGQNPPVFYELLTDKDIAYLKSKQKRLDIDITLGVALRCPKGHPQVLLCKPLSSDLKPFPTAFWLTCPFLDKKCGELETLGGVSMIEEEMRKCPGEVTEYHKAHIELRLSMITDYERHLLQTKNPAILEQLRSKGLGGIACDIENTEDFSSGAKCLHLQLASWLGFGFHPCMSWLARNFPLLSCS